VHKIPQGACEHPHMKLNCSQIKYPAAFANNPDEREAYCNRRKM